MARLLLHEVAIPHDSVMQVRLHIVTESAAPSACNDFVEALVYASKEKTWLLWGLKNETRLLDQIPALLQVALRSGELEVINIHHEEKPELRMVITRRPFVYLLEALLLEPSMYPYILFFTQMGNNESSKPCYFDLWSDKELVMGMVENNEDLMMEIAKL